MCKIVVSRVFVVKILQNGSIYLYEMLLGVEFCNVSPTLFHLKILKIYNTVSLSFKIDSL